MMMDNDFPVAMAGGKRFLEGYLPKLPITQKPQGYFREELGGERTYTQSGTNIPSFNVGQTYGQAEGGPVYEQLIAGSPSFDLRYPKTPGIGTENQSIEGIPNASPELIRKFVERKLRNPNGGQELPGFLKGA